MALIQSLVLGAGSCAHRVLQTGFESSSATVRALTGCAGRARPQSLHIKESRYMGAHSLREAWKRLLSLFLVRAEASERRRRVGQNSRQEQAKS